ncbi:MAG: tRNA-intron lyase [Nanoarchaeota archaeon]
MGKIIAYLSSGIISTNSEEARSLYDKSFFGEPTGEKVQYSFTEALYLLEKGKIEIYAKNKKLSEGNLLEKLRKIDRKIGVKYPVFRDLREKGYIVKTALKFGAEFRVYERGSSPKKSHAKWIVFTDSESQKLKWHEFAAKNRVAHSTKKKLLLAIVDDENDVAYYEVNWIKT